MNLAESHIPDLHPLLKNRWSPRTYDPSFQLSEQEVNLLFEAARWAPSSFNAQPWRYVYAIRQQEQGFQKMIEPLMEGNKTWAKDASMLILSLAKTDYEGRDGTNSYAQYDLGQANFSLVSQASAMGLSVRQMAGFSKSKAKELFQLPDNLIPVAYIAVGKPVEGLEKPANRSRITQEQIVTEIVS
ncbi:MAG: nitroreductase family protein [Bacteroidota bacterium]